MVLHLSLRLHDLGDEIVTATHRFLQHTGTAATVGRDAAATPPQGQRRLSGTRQDPEYFAASELLVSA
jgi:hypothetical protein